LVKYRTGIVV